MQQQSGKERNNEKLQKLKKRKTDKDGAKVTHKEDGSTFCSAVLRVKKDSDVLAGLYWVLLARNTSRPCVVTLPNQNETSPAQLSAMLKHLGLQAMALHRKMTAGQRNETVQRLKTSVLVSHAMVLVTTEHMLPRAVYAKADVVLVGAVSAAVTKVATAKFAHVHQVTATAAGTDKKRQNSSGFCPELLTPCLQQLQMRMKLARQILDIAQRVGKIVATVQDDDDKWARKLAKEADLDDDGDEEGQKKKRKRIKANAISASVIGEQKADSQHCREKLEVLGLVTMNAAVGTAMTGERTSAQTRWMDFAQGKAHGGQWDGPVRHGASKDDTSLALRERLCAAKDVANGSSYLSKWAPNKGPVDNEKWGGMFGKVCGHNEVVMNDLRAFYPQEVINSKICSKIFPAPGNQGFDGCLEHLRFACLTQHTSMTLWDAEYFIFISTRGRVTWSKKSQLLSLSLASLQCLVPALRSWTAASVGHMPPSAVLRAIQLCSQLGCGDKRGKLPLKAAKRIMSFAFGGSARLWRQIARVSTPLEEEIVYNPQ
ncbi:unnamed protein product [Peronospora destructor]|uniref:Helicase C-terminal domain-containing protein n=1 Tax=Peronospora destructor TaxID=86335 RepID=A0AAV0T6N9_9STRA|nr:unnamed protein product [Peronospora destructor]